MEIKYSCVGMWFDTLDEVVNEYVKWSHEELDIKSLFVIVRQFARKIEKKLHRDPCYFKNLPSNRDFESSMMDLADQLLFNWGNGPNEQN